MKIDSIEKWLKQNNLEFSYFGDLTPDGFTPKGYIVYTDYEGMYPPNEIYSLHSAIKKHFQRTAHKCVSSPSHTGLRIYVNAYLV